MKEFTLKQLFSIVDGRLPTTMDDVYDILGTASGQDLMTHHLPVARDFFEKLNPKWFVDAKKDIDYAKKEAGNDFKVLMWYLEKSQLDKRTYKIHEIDANEKKEFAKFMVENSLLLK